MPTVRTCAAGCQSGAQSTVQDGELTASARRLRERTSWHHNWKAPGSRSAPAGGVAAAAASRWRRRSPIRPSGWSPSTHPAPGRLEHYHFFVIDVIVRSHHPGVGHRDEAHKNEEAMEISKKKQ